MSKMKMAYLLATLLSGGFALTLLAENPLHEFYKASLHDFPDYGWPIFLLFLLLFFVVMTCFGVLGFRERRISLFTHLVIPVFGCAVMLFGSLFLAAVSSSPSPWILLVGLASFFVIIVLIFGWKDYAKK
jgi:hypothetical protein